MGEEGENHNTPLLADTSSSSVQLHGNFKRTGTLWTAIAHIITAVIGSGVLSLAWSVAQLGWIAGPLTLVGFAGIIVVSSSLLSDCYRSPDPAHGHTRNQTYMDAVRLNLGKKSIWICAIVQQISLFGVGIAYTITTSADARAIHKSTCIDKEGHQASCSYGNSFYMLLFGAVQIVCSQIPDFHNMEWLSFVAAIMSFSYSSIGFALGFAKVIGNGRIKGSIGGVTKGTATKKMWTVFQAIGDIAFAYPYSIVLLEIQNTLKSPPAENRTMKKASMISIFITTLFYLCCGCFGYAAFGDDTPGNLLTGFGFFEPYWLIDFANACVIVHLVGGYQVYSQPVFAAVEKWLSEKYPNSGFVNNFYMLKAPFLPAYKVTLLRLCFRTAYVVTTTAIATIFPYFNEVLGVLGAFNFWPLTIYFPVKMYFVQRKIEAWTRKWVILQTFSIVCLLVTVMALVGSIEGLVSAKLS
ncbi:probable amino acid permease 7 [Aristolochia californica]|uniref:probable amino acid permease 7 n=1 Tax=Aristolochia californica TaxID=171875 RepID=UPI0035DC263E